MGDPGQGRHCFMWASKRGRKEEGGVGAVGEGGVGGGGVRGEDLGCEKVGMGWEEGKE